jgi:hypothetical protein
MKKALFILFMLISLWIVVDSNYLDSFIPAPTPKWTIAIGSPIETDVFLFAKPTKDLIVTKIEGILQSGTSVEVTINKCNSSGTPASCSPIESNMTFNGDLDSTSSIDSPSVSANQTLQWVTESVSSPGFLIVIIHYRVLE